MTTKRKVYTLRPLWTRVRVTSCSDGTLRVEPNWKTRSHGLMTRMISASRLQRLVNAYLKRRKLP